MEAINFLVEEKYTEDGKALTVKRLVFRGRLKDEALRWYQRLDAATRSNWDELSNIFQAEYKLEARAEPDPDRYFNLLYNLAQGEKPIALYVQEAEDLYRKCPEALKDFMPRQFVAQLADESKLDIVQFYLATEREITFPEAKAAVVKAYSRIGRPSPFDVSEERSPHSKHKVSQNEVNTELVQLLRSLRMNRE